MSGGARGRARLAALVVVAALAAGVAIAVSQWRPRRAPGPPAPELSRATDAAIDQALRSAPLDSATIKSRWLDEVSGLAYDDLDPARREIFLRFANSERCTCGCGYTLAGCLASDMTCDVSRPRAQALLDSVRAGLVRDAAGARVRPRAGG